MWNSALYFSQRALLPELTIAGDNLAEKYLDVVFSCHLQRFSRVNLPQGEETYAVSELKLSKIASRNFARLHFRSE